MSDLPGDRQTLAGLTGVEVLVEELGEDVGGVLTGETLRTDVELRLRLAGIRVLTRDEAFRMPGAPFLYLQIRTRASRLSPDLFACVVVLEMVQGAMLERSPSTTSHVTTWSVGHLGIVGRNGFETGVREAVRDHVATFINAYLAVNPKKP